MIFLIISFIINSISSYSQNKESINAKISYASEAFIYAKYVFI